MTPVNKLLLLVVCIVVSCKAKQRELPYYNTPDFSPVWINSSDDPRKSITHRVGMFSFTDQLSTNISNSDLLGKVHVASFMFTNCTSICPKMMGNMQTIQKAFHNNKDVQLLSFTVTPWRDSIPRLKKYSDDLTADASQWHFLTGSTASIYDLARRSYFAEEQVGFTKDSTEFLHTEHFVLVDKHGFLRGIYNGTLALEAERIITDIRYLLTE